MTNRSIQHLLIALERDQDRVCVMYVSDLSEIDPEEIDPVVENAPGIEIAIDVAQAISTYAHDELKDHVSQLEKEQYELAGLLQQHLQPEDLTGDLVDEVRILIARLRGEDPYPEEAQR